MYKHGPLQDHFRKKFWQGNFIKHEILKTFHAELNEYCKNNISLIEFKILKLKNIIAI